MTTCSFTDLARGGCGTAWSLQFQAKATILPPSAPNSIRVIIQGFRQNLFEGLIQPTVKNVYWQGYGLVRDAAQMHTDHTSNEQETHVIFPPFRPPG